MKLQKSVLGSMFSFSYKDRIQNIQDMAHEEYDIAIIGGGINGAGVARDAASRGMKVALVEADDFASGTSSRSSKLVHGGIRYLENMEFHLVFEALSERRLLFEMAPHLVHPLRFVLPVYESAKYGMFMMGLGMWAYDALSCFEAPQMHENLNKNEALHRVPILNHQGLKGAFVYSDAYMDDDRLVIETLRSAKKFGAKAANFVKVEKGVFDSEEKLKQIVCRDLKSNKEFKIKARHFVSTVGAWTDIFGHDVLKKWKPILRPTKGIHLTLDRNRLPLKEAVVMTSDDQKRIIFAIPRHEMVIIGTTDTDFKGDPSTVHSDAQDVEYLLKIVADYFPGAKVTVDDIMSSYAGVRPLVSDGSESESKTSREHTILPDPRNLTIVGGGKYTTYRRIAEDVMKVVLKNFSLEEQVAFSKNDTKSALNDLASVENFERAKGYVPHWHQASPLSVPEVQLLAERHGMEVEHMLKHLGQILIKSIPLKPIWQIEAYHAIYHGMCLNLKDFYLRRVPLFLAYPDHGLEMIQEVAQYFAHVFGWSDTEIKTQIEAVYAHKKLELAWQDELGKHK